MIGWKSQLEIMRFSIYRRHNHFGFLKPKPVFRIIPRQCCLYDCLCVLWVFHLLFHDLFASYLPPHASFDWPTPPSDFKIIFATIIDLNKPVLWIWYSFQTFLSYEVKTNLLILSNVFSKGKKYPPPEAVWPDIYSKIHRGKLVHHGGHAAKPSVCWKTIRHLKIPY